MIGKAYFKRQATTLRKMVRVTRNQTIANRLTSMADEFDNRSIVEADESGEAIPIRRPPLPADREDD